MDHLESLGIKGVTLHQIKNIAILNELEANQVRIPTYEAARRLLNDTKSMDELHKEATLMLVYGGPHISTCLCKQCTVSRARANNRRGGNKSHGSACVCVACSNASLGTIGNDGAFVHQGPHVVGCGCGSCRILDTPNVPDFFERMMEQAYPRASAGPIGHLTPGGGVIQHRVDAVEQLQAEIAQPYSVARMAMGMPPIPVSPAMVLMHGDGCNRRVVNGTCECGMSPSMQDTYFVHAADCGCHECQL